MQNPIAESVEGLIAQISTAIPGVNKYGATIGLAEGTEAALTARLNDLVSANTTHKLAKQETKTNRDALKLAMKAASTYATLVREHIKPTLGRRYSEQWSAVGFAGSLQIPRKPETMLVLLLNLKGYLTANPGMGSADSNLTAAQGTLLHGNLLTAINDVNERTGGIRELIEQRNAKAALVKQSLRELIDDLGVKLGATDSRWLEFGLNQPGQKSTPQVPTNIIVILVGPTVAAVKWNRSTGADHYRVWKQVVGVDEGFVAVGSPADLDFALEELPTGATIKVAVSAVNTVGESALSVVKTLVTE